MSKIKILIRLIWYYTNRTVYLTRPKFYHFIMYKTLGEDIPNTLPKIPVTVHRFPTQIGYYFKAYFNDKLIHYRHTTIELHGRHYHFSPKWMQYQGIFDTDVWTDPEYRRNGVSMYVLWLIAQYWKQLGIYTFLEIIGTDNYIQIKRMEKTHSIPLGLTHELRIFNIPIYWQSKELKQSYNNMKKELLIEPYTRLI